MYTQGKMLMKDTVRVLDEAVREYIKKCIM